MKIARLDSQVFAVNCDPFVARITGVDVRRYMAVGVEYRRTDAARCTDCGSAGLPTTLRSDLVVVCENRPNTHGYLRSMCPEHAAARTERLNPITDWNFA